MMDWSAKSQYRTHNFCCATNWEHYALFFDLKYPPYHVAHETVMIYDGSHKYHICQMYDQFAFAAATEIRALDVDPEGRTIDAPKTKSDLLYSADKKLFDFGQTDREKILNRIKTILTFQ